jgi:hypothetical protein
LRQDTPIVGGAMGWVIVEAEAPTGPADTPYQLDLWMADGTRRISLLEIRFPAEPHPQGAQEPGPGAAPREQAEEPRKNPVPHVR